MLFGLCKEMTSDPDPPALRHRPLPAALPGPAALTNASVFGAQGMSVAWRGRCPCCDHTVRRNLQRGAEGTSYGHSESPRMNMEVMKCEGLLVSPLFDRVLQGSKDFLQADDHSGISDEVKTRRTGLVCQKHP